jgi:hypothetical protein
VFDPDPNAIDIRDIAHGLALKCRFSGHTREFYSVAQHSLMVASLLPKELRLTGLLHDASEAYLVDLPRPIKAQMPLFQQLEDGVMKVIAKVFPIRYPFPAAIKEADDRALWTEIRDLMPKKDDWLISNVPPVDYKIDPWEWQAAEVEFLNAMGWLGIGRP